VPALPLQPAAAAAQSLRSAAIGKCFDNGVEALRAVSFDIAAAEFVGLVGPSGCGKSTLLRIVAGLAAPSSGALEITDRAQLRPAFVFQEPTLLPWASVFDNVWLPLRVRGISRAEARPAIEAVLARVGLAQFERALPRELSGGMKMRVSLARALVTEPNLLLLDEPFAALDELTRFRLNDDLRGWWSAQQFTTLFVTHSVFEAVYLCNRVLVISARPGRLHADVPIEGPHERTRIWRGSPQYAEQCGRLSALLEQAAEA